MGAWKQRGNYRSVLEAITGLAGATPEELIHPTRVDPSQIENLPEAAQLIRTCLARNMPVVILGDYDADGITSTAILTKLFRHFGVEPRTIIPRRFTDGYGSLRPSSRGSPIPCSSPWTTALPGWSPLPRPRRRATWSSSSITTCPWPSCPRRM